MMNRCAALSVLSVLILTATPRVCRADTLFLVSSSSGVFDYDIGVDDASSADFNSGQQILLTGLSGVTSVSVINGGSANLEQCFSSGVSFTSSSVTLTANGSAECSSFVGSTPGMPTTYGTIVVDSSATATGNINYELQTNDEGNLTGTVEGPVDSVPEPGTLVIVCISLICISLLRRKIAY
jgi:hypothetical protein